MSAECRHVCAISLQLWSSVQLIDYIHVLIWQINQMLLNRTHSTQHNHSKIKHKAHFPCQPNILYFGTDIFSILMSQMPVEARNNKILYFIRWGRKKWYRSTSSGYIGRTPENFGLWQLRIFMNNLFFVLCLNASHHPLHCLNTFCCFAVKLQKYFADNKTKPDLLSVWGRVENDWIFPQSELLL